jgi:transposase
LSEHRKYRKFTAKQKLEIVLASLRGDRSVAELCREHGIAESLLRKWREQALEAAAERFESGQERSLQAEQRRRIAELERALGRKTYELEIAGKALAGWEVRHEALFVRAGCETPTPGGRSRLVKLRAA